MDNKTAFLYVIVAFVVFGLMSGYFVTSSVGGQWTNTLTMRHQNGIGSIFDMSMLRASQENFTGLILSPNGAGFSSGQSTWTTSLQLSNKDIQSDSTNTELMELTWENNEPYINVYQQGSGEKRDFMIKLDANNILMFKHTNVTSGNGYEIEYNYPLKAYLGASGSYTNPLNLNSLDRGSNSNPTDTPAICAKIPTGTTLTNGKNTFNIYNLQLSGTGFGLTYTSYANNTDEKNVTIDTLAIDNSANVAHQLNINVDNNSGNTYTVLGDITIYIELRR